MSGEILKSFSISKKALKSLNIGTRYFTKHRLRTVELYQNTPFVVTSSSIDDKMIGKSFIFKPMNDKNFRLIIEPSLKELLIHKVKSYINPDANLDTPIKYSKVHNFGEEIISPWFSLNVQKIYALQNQNYSFTIVPNNYMAGFINSSLSVSSVSEYGTIVKISFRDKSLTP